MVELWISLLLTVFVYLFLPIFYRCTNGKVSVKKGKRLALINSCVCAALFCVIRAAISGGDTIASNFAPAVLYYFIAKAILVDKNLPVEDVNNKSEDIENELEQDKSKKEDKEISLTENKSTPSSNKLEINFTESEKE